MLRHLVLCAIPASLFAVQYPSAPQVPEIGEPRPEAVSRPGNRRKETKIEKAPQTGVRIKIHLGDRSQLMAEATIPASYTFSHKKGQLQYNQSIRAEDIRELAIESYKARRISSGKEGDVFEFEPASVRIELKDGQVFRLAYLFKELRKLKAKNADGNFTVFAFFADTWKSRSGWQERPMATERVTDGTSGVSRVAHPAAFSRLEYFEPLDKGSAAGETQERP